MQGSALRTLTDFQSPDYQRALDALEKPYFGKENRPNMPIASVSASLGAELLIEFDTVNVVADEADAAPR